MVLEVYGWVGSLPQEAELGEEGAASEKAGYGCEGVGLA